MTYAIRTEPDRIEIEIGAATREELFREALKAVLEAACGAPGPDAKPSGQVAVVQAAGATVEAVLAGLLTSALEAARAADGALGGPRWLAFDEARATANLPVLQPAPRAKALSLARASRRDAGDGTAWAFTVALAPG